jgi:hypothetical protein
MFCNARRSVAVMQNHLQKQTVRKQRQQGVASTELEV